MQKKSPARPVSDALRHFHPHCRHQFLETHQVQHPFEVVSQRRQAPLRPHFHQTFEQKVRVAKPTLDGPKGMFANCFLSLIFGNRCLWGCYISLLDWDWGWSLIGGGLSGLTFIFDTQRARHGDYLEPTNHKM
jgi:hypothetical protein